MDEEDEDNQMGIGDLAEFIEKLNGSVKILDEAERTEVGQDQEEAILLTIPPACVISIIIIVLITLFAIFKYSYSKSSSGSSSGESLIRQRTISDQIEFIGRFEVGSFGRIYLCNFRGQPYICRVYQALEQKIWSHEADIHSLLKTPEVVGMIAKDMSDDPITASIHFLIITEYFANGSLNQFLQTAEINEITMLNLMYSIARGLSRLHAIILGNPNKPAIIHFNLKSRNIMVADCGSRCLISDFSTACTYDKDGRISESPTFFNFNSDSLRYRAPELLDTNKVPNDLKSALACDVYSFSLILWEIASRCILPGDKRPVNGINYQLPFEEELNNQEPNQQSMYQLVHLNKIRPNINNKWTTSPTLIKISQILNESWASPPSRRKTALRILKDLENLKENLQSKDDQKDKLISIEMV